MLLLCREENEKFNIWQAWLNLENMYGSPTPHEAVTRLFQKALPYCNAKKLYLALLDILERTNKVCRMPQFLNCTFSSSCSQLFRHQQDMLWPHASLSELHFQQLLFSLLQAQIIVMQHMICPILSGFQNCDRVTAYDSIHAVS